MKALNKEVSCRNQFYFFYFFVIENKGESESFKKNQLKIKIFLEKIIVFGYTYIDIGNY